MTQDELKALVARAALEHVVEGALLGVGSGSTVNLFIESLAASGMRVDGAVSSSNATSARLQAAGIRVVEAADAQDIPVYVDGADEIDPRGHMIKGGGGALTREKIVAAQCRRFVCIADESKRVDVLGRFPLPVEVIPMAAARIARDFAKLGGQARLRMNGDQPRITDNGQHILDVQGLKIADPVRFELEVSQWPGVVTVGVFALQKADCCLLGTAQGVATLRYEAAGTAGS